MLKTANSMETEVNIATSTTARSLKFEDDPFDGLDTHVAQILLLTCIERFVVEDSLMQP